MSNGMQTPDPVAYLGDCDIIDWRNSAVLRLSKDLADDGNSELEIARRCFEWVRDNISHSSDFKQNPVTCSASQTLAHKTGFCYAKSHLLCALLRANQIPAGLSYQRLSIDGEGPPYCLHGLNSLFLPEFGWYRIDPRGNKPGVDAQFIPPIERLAFTASLSDERDLPNVFVEPLPVVVDALMAFPTWNLLAQNLPDFT
jgi:transglutaminase-like putative cysteine protease